ncbi:MAG: hypothetical protein JWO20_2908 [Candidatus Angelobacter sp.]|jgi:glycosyltransferase involved in cell wall biosynthesis|nr:hypothetical protein [Candidatus Angelobacter sp.]
MLHLRSQLESATPAPRPFVIQSARPEVLETRIAVLIPCYNEELTIQAVIEDFKRELPTAEIYVFDNNSRDRSVERAIESGAKVLCERRQGKGFVVQAMFRDVDADIYIMVDGDGTYPASEIHQLLAPMLNNEADLVVGSRLEKESQSSFKIFNRLGNRFFLLMTNSLFGSSVRDMLSGYRVFNKRFVKGLPLLSGGFQIETELTIKALERGFRIVELPVHLSARPKGSFSKINILSDGLLISSMILSLVRDYKPLTFFGALGLFTIILGMVPGSAVILEYVRTGLVPKLPFALLAIGLVLAGLLFMSVGILLHSITRRFQEVDFMMQSVLDTLIQSRKREI